MIIANPIYDVVFKYLLEDLDIAKGLFSRIIGEEIESVVTAQRRLERAVSDEDFRKKMDIEDEIERTILKKLKEQEIELAEKDLLLAEERQKNIVQQEILAQKEEILAQKEQELAQELEALRNK